MKCTFEPTTFHRRKDSRAYYSPRLELNAAGHDPYFPDGTLCHRDATQSYHCLQHHCLPENFQLNKLGIPAWMLDDDVQIIGNAGYVSTDDAGGRKLRDYFTVDADGRPLRTRLEAADVRRLNGGGDSGGGVVVDADDYVELPAEMMMKYRKV